MHKVGPEGPETRAKIEGWAQDNLPKGRVEWIPEEEARITGETAAGFITFATEDGRIAETAVGRNEAGILWIGGTSEVGKPAHMDLAAGTVHDALKKNPPEEHKKDE